MIRATHEQRPGTIGFVALIALPVVVLLFGLVLFIAMGRDTRSEAQNGADAAALASACALGCDDLLVAGSDGKRLPHAGDVAVELAGQNFAYGERLMIRYDHENPEAGDIVFGRLAHPRGSFYAVGREPAEASADPINAVRVTVTSAPVRGLLGGVNASRPVSCRATAMLDWCAIGFRPKGADAAPLVPIGLFTDHVGERDDGWDACRRTGQDNWRFDPDTKQFAPGEDGIPEIVVVLGGSTGKGVVPGVFLRLGTDSAEGTLEQFRSGMTLAQCEKFPGGFQFGADNTLTVTGSPVCPDPGTAASERLQDALLACATSERPRIWPLFQVSEGETGSVLVSGWVGARVVSVGAHEGGGIRLVLQPAVVCHPSVLTDPDRTSRPGFWVTNRTVCRARLVE